MDDESSGATAAKPAAEGLMPKVPHKVSKDSCACGRAAASAASLVAMSASTRAEARQRGAPYFGEGVTKWSGEASPRHASTSFSKHNGLTWDILACLADAAASARAAFLPAAAH